MSAFNGTRPKVSASALRDAAMNLGPSGDDVRIVSYSGRAMYGEKCAAMVAPDEHLVAQILVELARTEPELAADLAARQRFDSMARSLVVYFPGVVLDGEPDE